MKKYIVAAIAIAIVVLMVATGFKPLSVLGSTADPVGKSFKVHGAMGGAVSVGAPAGDLFDSVDYVTSFTGGEESEKIVISPSVLNYGFPYGDGPVASRIYNCWIVLTFSKSVSVDYYGEIATGVTSFKTNPIDVPDVLIIGGKVWFTIPSIIIKLVGPVTAVMHADMYVHQSWKGGIGGIQKLYADSIVASDEATLKSGLGTVSVPSYTETGKDMILKVTAEYSHSDTGGGEGPGGWTLQLFDTSGKQVKSWDIPDHVSGYTVTYRVPDDAFSTVVGSTNNWLVELWNNLFRTHAEYTVVIKAGTALLMPPPPKIEASAELGKPPYPAGTPLSWVITGAANKIGYPLAGFRISVQYSNVNNQLGSFVLQDQWFEAQPNADNKSWSCYVDWTALQLGYYVISAQSVDNQNNPSVFGKLRIETGPANINDNDDDDGGGADMTLVIGIALAIVLLLVGIVCLWYRPFPYALWIGVGFLGAAVAVIIYVGVFVL